MSCGLHIHDNDRVASNTPPVVPQLCAPVLQCCLWFLGSQYSSKIANRVSLCHPEYVTRNQYPGKTVKLVQINTCKIKQIKENLASITWPKIKTSQ